MLQNNIEVLQNKMKLQNNITYFKMYSKKWSVDKKAH